MAIITPDGSMDSYAYRPLEKDQIRLLTPVASNCFTEALDFNIKTVQISQSEESDYRTVSYRWGDATTSKEVRINGHVLPVPAGTFDALRCIIEHDKLDRRPLWIDAICITQSDDEERAVQVALMGRIYAGATVNLIYLGEEDDMTQRAFKSIRDIVQELRETSGCHGGHRKEELKAMDRLFDKGIIIRQIPLILDEEALIRLYQRPWFRRVWVVQEAVLPVRSICLAGTAAIELNDIIDTAAWIIKYASLSLPPTLTSFPGVTAASTMWEHSALRHFRDGKSTGRLANTLIRMRGFECSDDRDRIFGIIGLTHRDLEVPELLRPDYGKKREVVFRDAMRYCVEREGARLLFGRICHRDEDDIWSTDCPSWVPKLWRPHKPLLDADGFEEFRPVRDALAHEMVRSATESDQNILLLKAVVLGRLQHLSPTLFTENGRDQIENVGQTVSDIVALLRSQEKYVKADDIARVLIADTSATFQRSTQRDRNAFQSLLSGRPIYHWLNIPADADRESRAAADFFVAMLWACRHRKFALTRKGSVGLVPKVCREGDLLVLLLAGSKPVLLRECGDGSGEFLVLGECYFEGTMEEEDVERLMRVGEERILAVR